ncbi:MAG: LamG-like jellyroll fold domain-containing protein [Candidatus Bathyarchaeia archaeon]
MAVDEIMKKAVTLKIILSTLTILIVTFNANFGSMKASNLLFFDDFNDGVADGWTEHVGTWNVINGEYHVRVGTYENGITTVNELNLTNCIIETKLRFGDAEEGYRAGIVFRYDDSGYYYAFEISNNWEKAELIYYTPTASGYGYIFASVNYTVQTNVNYTMKVKIDGNVFRGYINGDEVVSGTNANLTAGKVGLRARCGDVFYDDFKVFEFPVYPLVGCWNFNEGTGLIAHDTSGNSNNGILVNSPSWINGQYGKALHFNGIDSYVEVPHSNSLVNSNFTIEAWIYLDEDIGNQEARIVSKQQDNLHEYTLCIFGNGYEGSNGNQLVLSIANGFTVVKLKSNNYLSKEVWYHVAATHEGTLSKLYINGDLDASGATTTLVLSNTEVLTIGCLKMGNHLNWFFKGIIDEVKIYNRALSQSEIQADMIPEFPSFSMLPLFITATLIAAIIFRKSNNSNQKLHKG